MEIFIKIAQFVASFSLLVLIHELGHFLFARMFGIRVEKFYLFFNPWFSLFKFNWKGTEFGIGWVPFGGYCKIAGMIDESMDTEAMAQPPKPDEFRSKPAWQRLLVMIGGVLMNVVLALCIYIGMCYAWGREYVYNPELAQGSVFSELAHEIGFRDGDRVLSVGGEQFDDYGDIFKTIFLETDQPIEVLRDGRPVTITIDDKFLPRMTQAKPYEFMSPRQAFVVGKLQKGEGAERAGLRAGDRLLSLNGESMEFFDQFQKAFGAMASQPVTVGVERDSAGVATRMEIPVAVNGEGKIGVIPVLYSGVPVRSHQYTLLQSIPEGFKLTGTQISDYWKQLGMIFTPKTEAYKSVGGVIAIGNIFPTAWDWMKFWNITALLSIMLAIMNILPLPVLDGGHVVFLLYEVVTRRKPSDKFLEHAQTVGIFILLGVLLFANGNDIYRFFIK